MGEGCGGRKINGRYLESEKKLNWNPVIVPSLSLSSSLS